MPDVMFLMYREVENNWLHFPINVKRIPGNCCSNIESNQDQSKYVSSVRVPRYRAAIYSSWYVSKNYIHSSYVSHLSPKFILNHFRGLIEAFNCLAYIYKPLLQMQCIHSDFCLAIRMMRSTFLKATAVIFGKYLPSSTFKFSHFSNNLRKLYHFYKQLPYFRF